MTDLDLDAIRQMVDVRYPRVHVGYSRPAPDGCACDECYITEARRDAYVEGLAECGRQAAAVRLWAERFIPGDRWDTEDARDLEAALNGIVEAEPTAHDRRRCTERAELSGKSGELQSTRGAPTITDEMVERAAKEISIHRYIHRRRSPDTADRVGSCTCGAEGIGDLRAFALHRARAALEAALGVGS